VKEPQRVASQPSYFGGIADICAQLSNLAYDNPSKLRAGFQLALGPTKVVLSIRTIQKDDFRVLVASSDDAIFVVFRGTVIKSWRSARSDLKVSRMGLMNGLVHRGFGALMLRTKPFYKRRVKRADNGKKSLYFTGHSLGGAVAFLAAMDHVFHGEPLQVRQTYTFGQPRAGNRQLCRNAETALQGRCVRIVNRSDLFVGQPAVLSGYDHIRDFFQYNRRGEVHRRRQFAGQGMPFNPLAIRHHFMKKYLKTARLNVGTML
jgi:predicted lipase